MTTGPDTHSISSLRRDADRPPGETAPKSMDKIVALCRRRGFLFQSSEIYGGINGFWDYGPLGAELKRNIKDAWWRDMVSTHDDLAVDLGAPSGYEMVGLDCAIVMHPQVWKCSGHYDLFHDLMVDCRETKKRYRVDQICGRWARYEDQELFACSGSLGDEGLVESQQHALRFFGLRRKDANRLQWNANTYQGGRNDSPLRETPEPASKLLLLTTVPPERWSLVLAPGASQLGTFTEPREFNLMFKTIIGALGGEEDTAYLRPETAQGIFVNFKNVLDSSRVRLPFGIAQMGKSFRNEITPRYFTFRSREFEQMEIEFFCHPGESAQWYQYWRDRRFRWYTDLGLAGERLRLREHDAQELSHYSCGTADIEYAFPFLPPGEFGELEGIAHRGDFDLRCHMEGKLERQGEQLVVQLDAAGKPRHKGSGKDLTYRDDLTGERYVPHVIEPSAGADRAALAFLCEAYTEDEAPDDKGQMQSRVVLRLHPRLAPIKAAVLPLVKKDGMPELAQSIYRQLKRRFNVFYDEKGAIGRRYRRQDEIGTPWCITVDSQSLQDGTVTVRDRDTLQQWRIPGEACLPELEGRLAGEPPAGQPPAPRPPVS